LIAGFVIQGPGQETLLIRGDGPSLAGFGVAGALARPTLSVISQASGSTLATNAGWSTGPDAAVIAQDAGAVGAFPLPAGSADCAVVATLPAGAYTLQISGVNGSTGIALAEVYEVATTGTRLVNLSTRAQVETGANVVIAGFVVRGGSEEQLLVRGEGPALAQFGLTGFLAQPSLALVAQLDGVTFLTNAGWAGSPQVTAVGTAVGAFPLAAGSADSALVFDVAAGAYTARLAGADGGSGIGLVEVYEGPGPTP
jgi:hypothetical protein